MYSICSGSSGCGIKEAAYMEDIEALIKGASASELAVIEAFIRSFLHKEKSRDETGSFLFYLTLETGEHLFYTMGTTKSRPED